MSNELVKKDNLEKHDLSVIEQVVMQGDLAKLDPQQRVTYYHRVCESLGLNPYTRPFDYISLNGKLTLYAKKDATEQLRSAKKISITEIDGKIVDDLYIVRATAITPDGRTDQSVGAVTIGHLKGEQKANAIMKAETKAKRRVTLSIAGLGWTDESEIDSIPNAKPVNVNMVTGEMINIETSNSDVRRIESPVEKMNAVQAAELVELLNECDKAYSDRVYGYINKHYNTNSFTDVPAEAYPKMRADFIKQMESHHNRQCQELAAEAQ